MALVITVTADIEPQQELSAQKQIDTRSHACSSLSDYGSYTSETSFTYPGELLSDDEFSQEFSSHASSRRSSKDVPNTSLLSTAQIPVPPPPPPLPSASNMISFIHIPAPPPPPPLPHISPVALDYGQFQMCYHSPLFTGYCPNPNCPTNRDISDYYYTDEDEDDADTDSDSYLGWNRAKKRPSVITAPDAECTVCYSEVESINNTRKCCSQVVCKSCIREIVRTNIECEGNIHIPCPNPKCKDGVITSNEILSNVSGSIKEQFDKLRLRENEDSIQKTCPNCCLLTEHKIPGLFRRYRAENFIITCSKCQYVWCFRCHAPWHTSLTCRQFQKGDKHFKKWTKSKNRGGTANCQKCPLCRVYIQRSAGCDHMTCNRCDTGFCYKCGGRFTDIPGLGSHYQNTSIFGCSANYKPNKPILRKTVRGGYLAAKLAMLTGYPVLFVAGVAVVVLVGAVALPIYGGYRYYKFKKRTNELYRRHRRTK